MEIDNYQMGHTRLRIQEENGCKLQLDIPFAILFIEGKVLVEEFYTDPVLINWLFRNSKIENKLAGCEISSIVG